MLSESYKENLPPVTGVLLHGYNTFNLNISDKDQFNLKINKMREAVSRLTISNVELDQVHMDPETWAAPDKAPCTFIEVLRERTFVIGLFIVKPGFKIPLHNHPNMYGFLKVLNGTVTINSYTPCTSKHISKNLQKIGGTPGLSKNGAMKQYAKVYFNKVFNVKSPAFFFTPIKGNLHAIQVHNEPAVLFDVMSPSYDTPNTCKYFKISERLYNHYVELEEVPPPNNFYYDYAPYSHTFSM